MENERVVKKKNKYIILYVCTCYEEIKVSINSRLIALFFFDVMLIAAIVFVLLLKCLKNDCPG